MHGKNTSNIRLSKLYYILTVLDLLVYILCTIHSGSFRNVLAKYVLIHKI